MFLLQMLGGNSAHNWPKLLLISLARVRRLTAVLIKSGWLLLRLLLENVLFRMKKILFDGGFS